MASALAKQLPPLKTRSPLKSLPKEFQASYQPPQISPQPKAFSETYGTTGNLVTLSKGKSSIKQIFKTRALSQKKDIFKELEDGNMDPIPLLEKLSHCSTEYAKLIGLAAEELGYYHTPVRSKDLEDLERESAVNSAKNEVEIQQQKEKLIKLKADNSDLKEKVRKKQRYLEQVNSDIERLQRLYEVHVPTDETEKKDSKSEQEAEDFQKALSANQAPKLNDELYRKLWVEHTELLEQIESYKTKLKETQENQLVAMKEYVQKKLSQSHK